MTLTEIFTIIIIHWVADFVFQDEKWALGKSKNWKDLLSHTFTYSYCFLVLGFVVQLLSATYSGLILFNFNVEILVVPYLLFTLITFIAHTITDYFTSRIVSKKFENNHYGSLIPNFGAFTIIGFDQVLHYLQLFLTYYLLFK